MKLVSALLLFSMSAQAAPILKAQSRYQTDGSLISQPVITQGPNGEKLTVAIEQSLPEDRLTARNESGVKVADIAVYKSTRTERVSVLSAHLNVKGELIAITELSVQGMAGGSRLFADNMKTGFTTNLTQTTQYPQLVTRTQHQGKDLLAIEIDLGQGENGERPSLLRIVDEASGQVLKDIFTSGVIEGRFVVNTHGRLQLLTTGYNNFDLIDVASGVKTELLPSRTKPKAAPHFQQTVLGEVLQLSDHGATNLYDIKALADGKIKIVRHFNANEVQITSDGRLAIELSKEKIRIRDLATSRQIGVTLPRNPQPTEGTFQDRGLGSVQDILLTPSAKVVLLSQVIAPMTYMPGTALTYIDLETGKVLRKRRLKLFQLTARLMQDENGRVVAMERSYFLQHEPDLIVDVRNNAVTTTVANEMRQNYSQAASGRIVLVRQAEGAKLCLAFVDAITDETCIDDAMIGSNAIYGVELNRGKIVVPLDGNRGKQTFSVE